jgi:RNA polymerase sigma-70 factor (ECF subfamily)
MEQTLGRTVAGKSMETLAQESLQEAMWIAASKTGDAASFNHLVLKWERPIYNLALRMLQDADEAAETTQEVFLRAFRSIRGFRAESAFSTWLYRIAANQCATRLRQRPSQAHYSMDDEETMRSLAGSLPRRESHEGDLLVDEARRQVHGALAQLPAEQRLAVELKFFEELTFDEIALVVEAPVSTVKSRFYSGLDTLKNRLGRLGLDSGLR